MVTYSPREAAEGSLRDLLEGPGEVAYGGFIHEVVSLALGFLGKVVPRAMGWGFMKAAEEARQKR